MDIATNSQTDGHIGNEAPEFRELSAEEVAQVSGGFAGAVFRGVIASGLGAYAYDALGGYQGINGTLRHWGRRAIEDRYLMYSTNPSSWID